MLKSDNSAMCNESQTRDKRMFSAIQSQLGGARPLRPRPQKVAPESLKRLCCDHLFKELEKMNSRTADVSFQTLSAFLNDSIAHLSAEEVDAVAEVLCESALCHDNAQLVVDLLVASAHLSSLKSAFSASLMERIPEFIFEEEHPSLPDLMARILVARFPRPFNRSTDTSSEILYTILSTLKGWIGALCDEDDEEGASQMRARCAEGIVDLCMTAKRRLWVCWPEIVDEMYEAIQNVLTGNVVMSKEAKKKLLDLFVQINSWPNAVVKRRNQ